MSFYRNFEVQIFLNIFILLQRNIANILVTVTQGRFPNFDLAILNLSCDLFVPKQKYTLSYHPPSSH